jgi:hypothetical protein
MIVVKAMREPVVAIWVLYQAMFFFGFYLSVVGSTMIANLGFYLHLHMWVALAR